MAKRDKTITPAREGTLPRRWSYTAKECGLLTHYWSMRRCTTRPIAKVHYYHVRQAGRGLS